MRPARESRLRPQSPGYGFSCAVPLARSSLSKNDLENQHRVGSALHSRQLAFGEDDQIVGLHELQLQQAREQLTVEHFRGFGVRHIEDDRIDPAEESDPASCRLMT